MTIRIVTDSTCDLPKEILEREKIEVIPLSITIEGKSYLDGIDITKAEFLKKLVSSHDLPKSSQPAIGVFQEVYSRIYEEEGEDVEIISIHLTEGMSGTYQTASLAANMVDANVTVINSRFISHALGFQVLEAATLAKQGYTVNEIVERLNVVKDNSSLYIMVDTLEYLAKGGRIGKGKALLGSLLKIKPIASLADGVYSPVEKVRTHLQMIQLFTKKFEQETIQKGKSIKSVAIAHIDAEKLANSLKESLQQVATLPQVLITETSPIISTHTGPGAIALMYYAE
ncbi:DegV family protein [Alkalihalobacillus trypoxylicola]|uniref:Fatty acid-binding protein DegV n=1 Tax=Alkalihalobacillus trypoxylicola TaxID=519424 RepID=A0A161PLP3_9BACI|nr:DegV family protein [Alkalihalobacillus trypoxylicola]KYG34853.1 fatty acid-binding protein DegV [Alkalihalobacillus trypoxylicola]